MTPRFGLGTNSFTLHNVLFVLGMALRTREYAVHADYAHIRKYADADETLIHINHI